MPFSNTNLGAGLIYFFYGLAFFTMGLAILLEKGRCSDARLEAALRPLAGFGLLHSLHEWMVMLEKFYIAPISIPEQYYWTATKLILLALSFISLAGFGFSLLVPNPTWHRLVLLAPLALAAIWGYGIFILRGEFSMYHGLLKIADVWTRYSLGIPASLVASIGLIIQQHAFRRSGMAEFGRDSLVAAIAFLWYGLIGQFFTVTSRLVPSTYINEDLFFSWFHFPIQILRATLSIIITIFVIRFMRAFDEETLRQINTLQKARLEEAHQKEQLREEQLKQIVFAQEAERQRIARELHDETGQTLTAIGLGLKSISTTIALHPAKATNNLTRLTGMTSEAIKELQHIIKDLRPSLLDDLGLSATLRWTIKEMNQNNPCHFDLNITGQEPKLSEEFQITLFRIGQEGINNIIKHARATKASMRLCFYQDHTSLSLEDNGIGFDLDNLSEQNILGWGLLGIRERTHLLNGQFWITSKPDAGTRLEVQIPYPTPTTSPIMQQTKLEQDDEDDKIINR